MSGKLSLIFQDRLKCHASLKLSSFLYPAPGRTNSSVYSSPVLPRTVVVRVYPLPKWMTHSILVIQEDLIKKLFRNVWIRCGETPRSSTVIKAFNIPTPEGMRIERGYWNSAGKGRRSCDFHQGTKPAQGNPTEGDPRE